MRDFDAPAQAADKDVLTAPVELEGFAQGKAERNIGRTLGVGVDFRFPAPDKGADAAITSRVALRLQRLIQMNGGAPLAFVAVPVGFQPLPQRLGPRIEDADDLACRVVRLLHRRLAQPVPNGVAG